MKAKPVEKLDERARRIARESADKRIAASAALFDAAGLREWYALERNGVHTEVFFWPPQNLSVARAWFPDARVVPL